MNSGDQPPESFCHLQKSGNAVVRPAKVKWLSFFAILLAPPLVTLLCASINTSLGTGCALLGGAVGGAICGGKLGGHLGSTTSARVLFGILFSLLLMPLCIFGSFIGCAAGTELGGRPF